MKMHPFISLLLCFSLLLWSVPLPLCAVVSDEYPLHAGFPATATTGFGGNYPVIDDLDNDGAKEIIMTTGQSPNIYVFTADGQKKAGWPKTIQNAQFAGGFAVGDVDKDGKKEIVTLHVNRTMSYGKYGAQYTAVSSALTVWGPTGGIKMQKVFTHTNFSWISHVTISDVDSDGDMEIFFAVGKYIYGLHHNGAIIPGWPYETQDANLYQVAPCVADIDADGAMDIVMNSFMTGGKAPGTVYCLSRNGGLKWKKEVPRMIDHSVVLADNDGDGMMEIYFANGTWISGQDTDTVMFYCLDHTGKEVYPPVPIKTEAPYMLTQASGEMAVGDVDGDGDYEFAFNLYTTPELFVVHHDGSVLPGFPKRIGCTYNGGVSMADLDGDGDQEILYAVFAQNFRAQEIFPKALHAWQHDGSDVPGFPLTNSYTGGNNDVIATVGDLDNDGLMEIVWPYGNMFVFDAPGPFVAADNPWTTFHGNAQRTGVVASLPNRPPVVNASITPESGAAPLMVQYDASLSYDPDKQALTMLWNFGDDTVSNLVQGTHTYTLRDGEGKSTYSAEVVVKDTLKSSAVQTFTIVVEDKTAPVVTIETPYDGAKISHKECVVSGTARDNESRVQAVEISLYNTKTDQYIIENQPVVYDAEAGTWAYAFTKENLKSKGPFRIEVRAEDLNTNRGSAAVSVYVKPCDAAIAMRIVHPKDGQNVSARGFVVEGQAVGQNNDVAIARVLVSLRNLSTGAVFFTDVPAEYNGNNLRNWKLKVDAEYLTGGETIEISARGEDGEGNFTQPVIVTARVQKEQVKNNEACEKTKAMIQLAQIQAVKASVPVPVQNGVFAAVLKKDVPSQIGIVPQEEKKATLFERIKQLQVSIHRSLLSKELFRKEIKSIT